MTVSEFLEMALQYGFVFVLAIAYGTSYLFKFLESYDIPVLAVEILAGEVFGSWLGIISPASAGYSFLTAFAAFGLLMIMFDAGLELDTTVIKQQPVLIGVMGVTTFLLPFISGVGFALFFLNLGVFAAVLVGITVSTTSLGLVHPLLEDFNLLDADSGQTILAVTVVNDILSVIALAYAVTLTTATHVMLNAGIVTAVLLLFFVGVPRFVVPRASTLFQDIVFDNPAKFGLFLVLTFAFIFEQVGIHSVLGAFFAGFFIAEVTHDGHRVEQSLKPVLAVTAPVFFFYVGMNATFLSDGIAPLLLVSVILLGIGSKMAGAVLGGLLTDLDWGTIKLLAASMPGRLSISVAAAEIGRQGGLIGQGMYKAFLLLSITSVLVASLMFRHFARQTDEHRIERPADFNPL